MARSARILNSSLLAPSVTRNPDLRRGFFVRMIGIGCILGVLASLPFTVPLLITWLGFH